MERLEAGEAYPLQYGEQKEMMVMPSMTDVLWLNVSPSLQRFDQRLIGYLGEQVSVTQWEYRQSQDEPSSLDQPLRQLHEYFQRLDQPVHLIGHSTAGLLGWLYTRHYPQRVRSLTLLGVGVYPAVDWQAHYYVQRLEMQCPRQMILRHCVYSLFGNPDRGAVDGLVSILERDLESSPSPHSLYKRVYIPPGGVWVPLMICGSLDDIVVDPQALEGWLGWLKEGDRLWECLEGGHFFHHFHPRSVGEQLLDFWKSVCPHSSIQSSLRLG